MATSQELQTAAVLGHLANQMQLNVTFLESQNYLSAQDAATMREIIGRLPVSNQALVTTTTQVAVVQNVHAGARAVPPVPKPIAVAPCKADTVYARAIWSYNEDGVEPNDLSFSAGEMIEVVSEKNQDWWLGRARGREALFPSNHVEKVDTFLSPPTSTATATATARPYRPFGAALHGADTPPANGAGVNSIGLQQSSGQAEKKSKYGALGNTMAHSAAGGAGFGAGAAIGGGLVRAIF
ncbi:SH3 domain-containing protein [Phlebopus sp. FC_14]|nr:SH3 domain-containing protein [Phlebopus sp. FC_14]